MWRISFEIGKKFFNDAVEVSLEVLIQVQIPGFSSTDYLNFLQTNIEIKKVKRYIVPQELIEKLKTAIFFK